MLGKKLLSYILVNSVCEYEGA